MHQTAGAGNMLTAYIGVCGFLAALVLLYLYAEKWSRHPNLPPSPTYVQFLTTVLCGWINGKPPYEIFQDMSKAHGSVIIKRFERVNLVLLQDFNHIKEALTNEYWVDRHYDDWMAKRAFGKTLGVVAISGEVWKEMRRFCIHTLREFGFRNSGGLDRSLHDEFLELADTVRSRSEQGNGIMEIKGLFTIPVLNTLWAMVTGARVTSEDAPQFQRFFEMIDTGFKEFPIFGPNPMTLHAGVPSLAKLISFFSKTVEGAVYSEKHDGLHQFFRELLEERRARGEYKYDQRSYIDVFLREIDKNTSATGINQYTDDQFIILTMDLFFAGTETTNNTLEFAILYMILYPEVQARVQAEIDEVIGTSRYPSLTDKSKMNFTAASLLEVHRRASVVPLDVRSPTRDTQIGKYFIPNESIGIINFYSMNMDESTWKNPHEFNPERFIDSENNIINANKILPFGAGKRVCFGETLASATLFIFFTSLLQRFTFELSPQHPTPSMKQVPGFTNSPEPFHFLVKKRSLP